MHVSISDLFNLPSHCFFSRATLVAELVKRAEVMLQEKVKEDNTNHDKLLDEVCTQLYEEGAQAFLKGRE